MVSPLNLVISWHSITTSINRKDALQILSFMNKAFFCGHFPHNKNILLCVARITV